MKKMLLVLFVLLLCACSSTDSSTANSEPIEHTVVLDDGNFLIRNRGVNFETIVIPDGDRLTLPSKNDIPAPFSDYFVGWEIKDTGEKITGSYFTPTEDTTLRALWDRNAKDEEKEETKPTASTPEPAKEEKPTEDNSRYINPEFQKEAEANAAEHVAGPGKVLVTKGDHHFTGMKYYFKGELVGSEYYDGDEIWLLKNDLGYIMPVEHMHFEAAVGDTVEVWGNLSGEGFKLHGYDNVVGETGFINASFATVNGEIQY